jgi:hypothetical protein
MKFPVEFSEDRKRGTLPHIRSAIESLQGALNVPCARCRKRATHLIDGCRRAACDDCARAWASLTPLERRRSRGSR